MMGFILGHRETMGTVMCPDISQKRSSIGNGIKKSNHA